MFQSLSRDSGRLNRWRDRSTARMMKFQSLSRDSGRLNHRRLKMTAPIVMEVSIPQSGFGAFEPPLHWWMTTGLESFNPSVGIRGV